MNLFEKRRGAVLGVVVVILLMMALFATALLKIPGSVRRQVPRYRDRMQAVYRGESAIISRMEQFPSGYFNGASWNMNLPEVEFQPVGPWMKIAASVSSSEKVAAYAGVEFRSLGFPELKELSESFADNLNASILGREDLVAKSGSRRISGEVKKLSMVVTGGDITLNLEGHSTSLNFMCDGSVSLGGDALLDTLRIYAQGPIVLGGQVQVQFLELYGGDAVELKRNFTYSGLAVARNGVSFRDRSSIKFPAVAASVGELVTTDEKLARKLCGASLPGQYDLASRLVSAKGVTQMDRHLTMTDSLCLLPASVGGKLHAFRWSLE